jgi:excisionase family DNA binding protein
MSSKLLYRINEAAAVLGRSRSRIYELIAEGELEVVKDGRSALVTAESLHAFIESLRAQTQGAVPSSTAAQGATEAAVSVGVTSSQSRGRAPHRCGES